MKRRSILAGFFALTFLFFAFVPLSTGQETHPCVEVYAGCAFMAFSSSLSLRQTAEWLHSCSAMYVSCLIVYYLPPFL